MMYSLRATRRFVTWAAVVLAAALASACDGGGNGTAKTTSTPSLQGEGPARPGNLLAPNRTHLSLCVDTAGGGSVTSNELDAVSTALDSALASLDRIPPEFGQPSVSAGCPAAIPLTGERLDSSDLCCQLTKVISDPALSSPHRVFVYFVADEIFVASFGDIPYIRGVPETFCEGDTCSGMTVSTYVRSSAGTGDIAQAILRALALDQREPVPTFDLQSFVQTCEQGTPEPGCDRYLACLMGTPSEAQCNNLWIELGLEPRP